MPARVAAKFLIAQEKCQIRTTPMAGVECFPLGPSHRVCGACPPGTTGDGETCNPTTDSATTIDNVPNKNSAVPTNHVLLNQINPCLDQGTNPCYDKSLCRQALFLCTQLPHIVQMAMLG